jgi:hypothetical protein
VPSAAEAAAVVGALVVTTAQVAVRSIRWSVNRPYAAALREARDQPAPPAAMAGYSARLAVSTTGTGLVYMLLAGAGNLVATAALTLGFGLLALRRFLQLVGRWDDPALRTRVLATVAGARA